MITDDSDEQNIISQYNVKKENEDDMDEESFFKLGSSRRKYWEGDSVVSDIKVEPLLITEYSTKNNQIVFNVESPGWIDPYSLKFEFELENTNSFPLQLDSSIHSMISDLTIKLNDNVIESYQNYAKIKKFEHDLRLTLEERSERRQNEGFADNEDGDN
jgi:hypothetical protein